MENRAGIFVVAVLVVGAAFVAITGRGTAPTRTTVQAEGRQTPGAVLKGHCGNAPEPLAVLCEHLYPADQASPPSGTGWRDMAWAEAARGRVSFLVATVADPQQTRLTLFFDRAIESIQRAAESAGYIFDSYWFPWRPTDKQPAGEAQEFSDQPGALLFRSGSGRFLMVFVVGESPVSGIRRLAFLNAIDYVTALSPSGSVGTVRISGPNFSGSLVSLQKAIDDAAARLPYPATPPVFRVISGSTTVLSAMEAFRRREAAENKPAINFNAILHNDTFSNQRFEEYIQERWGDGIRSAFLSEGETMYGLDSGGEQARGDGERPVRLTIRFPREIARLRNAYPEATVKNLFSPGGAPATEPQLELPMKDPQTGRDSATSYAREQMPVAQEAVLLDIVSTLRQEKVRIAGIAATDVFDAIFLSSFLRKACPDVRLYVSDADMLFTRAAARLAIEGVLTVTTYPMITRNQLWSVGRPETAISQRSPVASRYELGVFNATRALLLEQEGKERDLLLEHFHADGEHNSTPPLWLTVLGTNGYWPVAFLDKGKKADLQLEWRRPAAATKDQKALGFDPGEPTRLWKAIFWTLVLVSLAAGALTVLSQLVALRKRAPSGWLAHFDVRPAESGYLGRAYFLMAQCLALAAMQIPFSTPVWVLASRAAFGDWTAGYARISTAATVVLMLGALIPYVRIMLARRRTKRRGVADTDMAQRLYGLLAFVTFVAFAVVVLLWWKALQAGENMEPLFFAYRSLDLLNGVCPVLPFLVLGAGLLLMARLHARRHALYLEMPAKLPQLGDDFRVTGLDDDLRGISEVLGHPGLADWKTGGLLLLPALAIFFAVPSEIPQSLEGKDYDVAYQLVLRFLYALAVFTWARLLIVWRRLRPVLDKLERHPLRFAFASTPSGYSALPILQGRGRHGTGDLLARSAESLRALAHCPAGEAGELRAPTDQERKELEIMVTSYLETESREGVPATGLLQEIWEKLAGIGTSLAGQLKPCWSRGCSTDEAARPRSAPRAEMIAEEFLALQYLAFLGNTMHQLRNLLFYVTSSFFLGILSALIYPFRSHDQIVWAATAGFLIMGLPVVAAIIQMDRDELLRRMTRREGGRTTGSLVLRLAAYGALPILGLVGSYFPNLGRFVMSWLEPAMKALP